MGAKQKEVGGGPATGLADNFVHWLSQGLNTGSFGAGAPAGQDAYGSVQGGMGSYLNDIFKGPAGTVGGATQTMITRQGDRDAAALRARFGVGGGTAFGSPGAFAEGVLRSETAPKLVSAIGNQQQQALSMLLPIFAGLASKGITQRQTISEENPWMTAAKLGLQGGSLAAGLMTGNPAIAAAGMGAAGGMGGGGGYNVNDPNQNMFAPSNWQLPAVPMPVNWS